MADNAHNFIKPTKPVYLGWFLSPETRQALLDKYPAGATHAVEHADHVTFSFGPKPEDVDKFHPLVGAKTQANVTHFLQDERVQAVLVNVANPTGTRKTMHITLRTAPGVKPVDSNRLIGSTLNLDPYRVNPHPVEGTHDYFPRVAKEAEPSGLTKALDPVALALGNPDPTERALAVHLYDLKPAHFKILEADQHPLVQLAVSKKKLKTFGTQKWGGFNVTQTLGDNANGNHHKFAWFAPALIKEAPPAPLGKAENDQIVANYHDLLPRMSTADKIVYIVENLDNLVSLYKKHPHVLESLAKDPDTGVRNKLATNAEYLPQAICDILAKDPNETVRHYAFAYGNVSQSLQLGIVGNPDTVSMMMSMVNNPHACDEALVQIIKLDSDYGIDAVSKRSNLSDRVFNALVNKIKVDRAVRNPNTLSGLIHNYATRPNRFIKLLDLPTECFSGRNQEHILETLGNALQSHKHPLEVFQKAADISDMEEIRAWGGRKPFAEFIWANIANNSSLPEHIAKTLVGRNVPAVDRTIIGNPALPESIAAEVYKKNVAILADLQSRLSDEDELAGAVQQLKDCTTTILYRDRITDPNLWHQMIEFAHYQGNLSNNLMEKVIQRKDIPESAQLFATGFKSSHDALVKNHKISALTAWELYKRGDVYTKGRLADNPAAPPELVSQMMADDPIHLNERLAARPKLTPAQIEALSSFSDYSQGHRLDDYMAQGMTLEALGKNTKIKLPKEVQQRFLDVSQFSGYNTLRTLTNRKDLHPEIATTLIEKIKKGIVANSTIIYDLANNPSTPIDYQPFLFSSVKSRSHQSLLLQQMKRLHPETAKYVLDLTSVLSMEHMYDAKSSGMFSALCRRKDIPPEVSTEMAKWGLTNVKANRQELQGLITGQTLGEPDLIKIIEAGDLALNDVTCNNVKFTPNLTKRMIELWSQPNTVEDNEWNLDYVMKHPKLPPETQEYVNANAHLFPRAFTALMYNPQVLPHIANPIIDKAVAAISDPNTSGQDLSNAYIDLEALISNDQLSTESTDHLADAFYKLPPPKDHTVNSTYSTNFRRIAKHPNLSDAKQIEMASKPVSGDPQLGTFTIASRDNLSEPVMRHLDNLDSSLVAGYLALQPNLPKDLLEKYFKMDLPPIDSTLASRTDLPHYIQNGLYERNASGLEYGSSDSILKLAENTTTNPELLERMLWKNFGKNDVNLHSIQKLVAKNPNLPSRAIDQLTSLPSDHLENEQVKNLLHRVAGHANASPEALDKLIGIGEYLTATERDSGGWNPEQKETIEERARKSKSWLNVDTTAGTPIQVKLNVNKLRQLRDEIGSAGGAVSPKTLGGRVFPKEARLPNGDVSALLLHRYIQSAPTIKYNISESEWRGCQRHSDVFSNVIQVNLTNEIVGKLREEGLYGEFRKIYDATHHPMHDLDDTGRHPVSPNHGIGWVRWTGSPENGLHTDEGQSDFARHIYTLYEHAGAKGASQEDHAKAAVGKRIHDIVFHGKHSSEALQETAHQFLRQKPEFLAVPIHIWDDKSKAKISLGNKDGKTPGHIIAGYGQTPKKMGMTPGTYGEIPEQDNVDYDGWGTHKDEIRKFEKAEGDLTEEELERGYNGVGPQPYQKFKDQSELLQFIKNASAVQLANYIEDQTSVIEDYPVVGDLLANHEEPRVRRALVYNNVRLPERSITKLINDPDREISKALIANYRHLTFEQEDLIVSKIKASEDAGLAEAFCSNPKASDASMIKIAQSSHARSTFRALMGRTYLPQEVVHNLVQKGGNTIFYEYSRRLRNRGYTSATETFLEEAFNAPKSYFTHESWMGDELHQLVEGKPVPAPLLAKLITKDDWGIDEGHSKATKIQICRGFAGDVDLPDEIYPLLRDQHLPEVDRNLVANNRAPEPLVLDILQRGREAADNSGEEAHDTSFGDGAVARFNEMLNNMSSNRADIKSKELWDMLLVKPEIASGGCDRADAPKHFQEACLKSSDGAKAAIKLVRNPQADYDCLKTIANDARYKDAWKSLAVREKLPQDIVQDILDQNYSESAIALASFPAKLTQPQVDQLVERALGAGFESSTPNIDRYSEDPYYARRAENSVLSSLIRHGKKISENHQLQIVTQLGNNKVLDNLAQSKHLSKLTIAHIAANPDKVSEMTRRKVCANIKITPEQQTTLFKSILNRSERRRVVQGVKTNRLAQGIIDQVLARSTDRMVDEVGLISDNSEAFEALCERADLTEPTMHSILEYVSHPQTSYIKRQSVMSDLLSESKNSIPVSVQKRIYQMAWDNASNDQDILLKLANSKRLDPALAGQMADRIVSSFTNGDPHELAQTLAYLARNKAVPPQHLELIHSVGDDHVNSYLAENTTLPEALAHKLLDKAESVIADPASQHRLNYPIDTMVKLAKNQISSPAVINRIAQFYVSAQKRVGGFGALPEALMESKGISNESLKAIAAPIESAPRHYRFNGLLHVVSKSNCPAEVVDYCYQEILKANKEDPNTAERAMINLSYQNLLPANTMFDMYSLGIHRVNLALASRKNLPSNVQDAFVQDYLPNWIPSPGNTSTSGDVNSMVKNLASNEALSKANLHLIAVAALKYRLDDTNSVSFVPEHTNKLIALCRNPNIAPETLGLVLDHVNEECPSDGSILEVMADNPVTPPELLGRMESIINRGVEKHTGSVGTPFAKALASIRIAKDWLDPDAKAGTPLYISLGLNKLRQLRDDIGAMGGTASPKLLGNRPFPKEARLPNGDVSAALLHKYIQSQPTHRFNITHAEWGGAQRHSDDDQRVFQVNATTDLMNELRAKGQYIDFRRVWDSTDTGGSHPLGLHGLGWVRWTGEPGADQGVHDDEGQSDFARYIYTAYDDAKKYPSPENTEKATKLKALHETVFKGRHSSEILQEAFLQHLREKPEYVNTPIHIWTPESKATISLNQEDTEDAKKLPGHLLNGYRDTPTKRFGWEESTYGELPTQTGDEHTGKPTYAGVILKTETEELSGVSDFETALGNYSKQLFGHIGHHAPNAIGYVEYSGQAPGKLVIHDVVCPFEDDLGVHTQHHFKWLNDTFDINHDLGELGETAQKVFPREHHEKLLELFNNQPPHQIFHDLFRGWATANGGDVSYDAAPDESGEDLGKTSGVLTFPQLGVGSVPTYPMPTTAERFVTRTGIDKVLKIPFDQAVEKIAQRGSGISVANGKDNTPYPYQKRKNFGLYVAGTKDLHTHGSLTTQLHEAQHSVFGGIMQNHGRKYRRALVDTLTHKLHTPDDIKVLSAALKAGSGGLYDAHTHPEELITFHQNYLNDNNYREAVSRRLDLDPIQHRQLHNLIKRTWRDTRNRARTITHDEILRHPLVGLGLGGTQP